MILLFGGTSETAPLARMLARAGHQVLVSTATPMALDTGRHRHVRRRSGRMDASAMIDLMQAKQIKAVVDAAHPYAEQLHATVAEACKTAGVRLLRYQRPSLPVPDREEIRWAADHASAATMACRPGARVLLTIGSKHIGPYVRAAQENRSDLFARVLPEPDSLEACRRGGLSREQVIAAIGPFCLEENLNLLRRLEIDVLVTKESGVAGGLPEKIEAALARNCRIVIIQRPVEAGASEYLSFVEIVQAVSGSK
jgi:precorrin-6A/cobalt-precorrin-6A reductase